MHKHLRRLDRIWPDSPIYFITVCTKRLHCRSSVATKNRRAVLARDEIAEILIGEWGVAHKRHGWVVGRYAIMPDHVHFFCKPELGARKLSEFIGAWKRWTSRRINALGGPRSATAATALWQRQFFDHVLRSSESYSEKWNYVFDNPVRAGLVSTAEWRYAGGR
jgi:putative transposase